MNHLLWVDCCMRGPEQSRTHRLCSYFLREYAACHPCSDVFHRNLYDQPLPVLTGPIATQRDGWVENQPDHPMLTYAREVAQADLIVIGAPYWDLSFPAALKIYLEWASVRGITFGYTSSGQQVGLSQAKALVYITTGGGPVAQQNYGFDYITALGAMFGISASHCIVAQGLDILGADTQDILSQAQATAHALARQL